MSRQQSFIKHISYIDNTLFHRVQINGYYHFLIVIVHDMKIWNLRSLPAAIFWIIFHLTPDGLSSCHCGIIIIYQYTQKYHKIS